MSALEVVYGYQQSQKSIGKDMPRPLLKESYESKNTLTEKDKEKYNTIAANHNNKKLVQLFLFDKPPLYG